MPEELSNVDRRALDLALANLFFATGASLNTVIEARGRERAVAEPMADAATEAMSQQRSQLDSLLQERFKHCLRAVVDGLFNLPKDDVKLIGLADRETQSVIKQATELKNSLAQGHAGSTSAAPGNVEDLQKLWDKSPAKDVPTGEERRAAFLTARLQIQQVEAELNGLASGAKQGAALVIYERLKGAREEFFSTVHSWKRRAGVRFNDWTKDSRGKRMAIRRADTDQQLFQNCNLPFPQQLELQ
jgi:hypothetical protein